MFARAPLQIRYRRFVGVGAVCLSAFATAACPTTGPTGGTNTVGQSQEGLGSDGNGQTPAASTPAGSSNDVVTSPNATEANPNQATSPNVAGTPNQVATNPNAPIPNGNDVAVTTVATVVNPNIDFNEAPALDNKAVALTFDDGPDGAQGATTMVLDTLKAEGLKATFFLCANIGFANLQNDKVAQAQLKRIIAEGHQTANHTYSHQDLATLSNADVDAQFKKLQDVYNEVLGPTAPVMTLVRAPFGSPFQLDNPNTQRVASTVTKYGVQVGWGMDPKDWTFDHYSTNPTVFNADVQDVINSVQKLIDNKQWGIILLHAVHLPSATALPTVIKMFRDNGYHFVSVEDVIRSVYGANSASIMAANKKAGTAL